jgi:hypothetical protein
MYTIKQQPKEGVSSSMEKHFGSKTGNQKPKSKGGLKASIQVSAFDNQVLAP